MFSTKENNSNSKATKNRFQISLIVGVMLAMLSCGSAGYSQNDLTWTYKTPMPHGKGDPGITAIGQTIYTFGGHTDPWTWPYGRICEAYDASTDTWTSIADLPHGDGRYGLEAIAVNGKIYTFGGTNVSGNYNNNNIDEYDPATNTWIPYKAKLPVSVSAVALAQYNGKIYIFGGGFYRSYDPWSNNVYEYDPVTNTVTAKALMPTKRGYAYAATVGDKIYMIGGIGGNNASDMLDVVEMYDPVTNEWTTDCAPLPTSGDTGGGVINGKIYVNVFRTTEVHEYDPSADAWTAQTPMQISRAGQGIVAVDNRLYVMGGYIPGHVTSSVEEGILGQNPTAPDIDVSPAAYDFGDVEIDSAETMIISVSNTGNADLTVTNIAFLTGGSDDFVLTSRPELPASVSPGSSVDIEIAFAPSTIYFHEGVLEISTNDTDEPTTEVGLGGVGVQIETPPNEQIEEIVAFIDASVLNGTLQGAGKGNSAAGRLNALSNMVSAAGDLIDDGLLDEAYEQLQDARKRCDGQSPPPDFVQGPATTELAAQIDLVMQCIAILKDRIVIQLDNYAMPVLTVGVPVAVSGTILQYDEPAANLTFAVIDGIGQVSRMLTTDSQGKFSFTTAPLDARPAIVEFVIGTKVISAGYEVYDAFDNSNPIANAVQIYNPTETALRCTVVSPSEDELVYKIEPGGTQRVVGTVPESMFTFKPTTYAGVSYQVGLVGGGSLSATTNDQGVATLTATAGVLLTRFSVYGTSELDLGACWSPGGTIGAVVGIEGGFDICLGSDGFSVGAGGTIGVTTAGFTIQIMEW